MQIKTFIAIALSVILSSCNSNQLDFDASGNFEADEVIVSAEQNGQINSFAINEGQHLAANELVGLIDVEAQKLQKEQNQASIQSLKEKTVTPSAQIEVVQKQLAAQQAQMQQLLSEKSRVENLVKADAAPRKQLDDMTAQIDQLNKQMAATRSQINLYSSNATTQNRSILSETVPLQAAGKQIQYQINKGQILNPLDGTVLSKYAMEGEMATIGRPLYKIANLDTLNLKAYVTGDQLPKIKIGQEVTTRIDNGDGTYKNYTGIITWISDKSEFTPKTIQTKKERENLVYAIKVRVPNDGFLKIGMYGEVLFNTKETK